MSDDPQRGALFLERSTYRRRRLGDAARLLPVFGALALGLPMLWPVAAPKEDRVAMSDAMLYIFGVWVVLILAAALFGRAARRRFAAQEQAERAGEE